MSDFVGSLGSSNIANADTGVLVGFTGTLADLQDSSGDSILGGNLADTISGGPGQDTIDGGAGNDVIDGREEGVSASHNTVFGGSGDDRITSRVYDKIYGGAGNDSIIGPGGVGHIEGGAGADRLEFTVPGTNGNEFHAISYIGSSAAIIADFRTYDFSGGDAEGDTVIGFVSLDGSNHDDLIHGNGQTNILRGMGGRDTIYGGAGNDIVDGGSGVNSLYGGTGDDAMVGSGTGGNLIDGGAGRDSVSYSDSSVTQGVTIDLATGQVGGAAAGDRLISIEDVGGSDLGDVIRGRNTDEDLSGHGGNDTVYGGGGNDNLSGGFDDNLSFNGNDTYFGGAGNDYLGGAEGGDSLYGDAGDDRFLTDEGADLIFGGDGHDTVLLDTHFLDDGLTINLVTGNHIGLEVIGDRYVGVEYFDGSDDNDTLIGDNRDQTLDGDYGDDTLVGNDGDDVLDGDNGNDSLNGGKGDDTLTGGDGTDFLDGGAGSDTFDPDFLFDAVTINLATGRSSGDDAVSGVTLRRIENVYLSYSTDDSTIIGSRANNRLTSGYADDSVSGGAGADTLVNRGGADRMEGGGGRDSFVFNALDGLSRVTDFGGNETIGLLKASFGAVGKRVSAGELRIGAAARDGDDHLIYNDRTGLLSWDVDGRGGQAAVGFANIGRNVDLTADSFDIV